MNAWYFFVGSTLLQFGPFFIVWAALFGGLLSDAFVLEYLLESIIVPSLVPVFLLTNALWIYVIISGRGNDDYGFSLVEPIIIEIFYFFYSFSTAWMILCDYKKAILYYDPDEKLAYQEYL